MAALELPRVQVASVALLTTSARPLLINQDPAPGESRVPVDTGIALELINPGTDGIDGSATRVWVDGVLAFDGQPVSRFVAVTVQTADSLSLELRPTMPMASLARVTVRVVASTSGGAHSLDESYSFTVEDRVAPRLLGAQAVGPRVVRLTFDEAVAVPDQARAELVPQSPPTMPLTVLQLEPEGRQVDLALDTEMTPDVEYGVRVAGVTDVSGNPVLPPFDRARFLGFRPPRPATRRFDLWRMLPKHNRRDDATGDLWRFISCLQEVTDLLLADVDRWPDIFDLERAPEPFLDLILRDLGNPFPFELDVRGKRRLAALLVDMYRQKGTAQGIQNTVRFFLGIEIVAITALTADTLVLGESILGVDWVLGPSDRFARYAFNVVVGRILSPIEHRQLRAIVDYLKPAHTHFVDLIEPFPPVIPEHWELGLSDLSDTSLLH